MQLVIMFIYWNNLVKICIIITTLVCLLGTQLPSAVPNQPQTGSFHSTNFYYKKVRNVNSLVRDGKYSLQKMVNKSKQTYFYKTTIIPWQFHIIIL